jgi:hypothetical protein
MSEWEKLGSQSGMDTWYEHSNTPHWVHAFKNSLGEYIAITNTEALAFACKLPEVRALAEAAHRVEVMLDTLSLLGVSQQLPPQYRDDYPGIHIGLRDALVSLEPDDDAKEEAE